MEIFKTIAEVCMRNDWEYDATSITLALGGGRKQVVNFEGMVYEGREVTRIYTRVGALANLSETQLSAILGLNFSMAFGALAAYRDDLVMVYTLLLREGSHDQLATSIRFLAETSDRYEGQIYGTDQY